MLVYGRADGMPNGHQSMILRGRTNCMSFIWTCYNHYPARTCCMSFTCAGLGVPKRSAESGCLSVERPTYEILRSQHDLARCCFTRQMSCSRLLLQEAHSEVKSRHGAPLLTSFNRQSSCKLATCLTAPPALPYAFWPAALGSLSHCPWSRGDLYFKREHRWLLRAQSRPCASRITHKLPAV